MWLQLAEGSVRAVYERAPSVVEDNQWASSFPASVLNEASDLGWT